MWSHVPQYMTCHTWMLKSPWLGASLFLPRKRCIVQDCSSLALNTNARNACLKCPDLTLPNKAWYHWNWICLKLRAVVNVAVLEHSPHNHSVVEYTYSLNYQCSLSLVHCELASYSPTVKWAEFSSQCMSGQGHIITKKKKTPGVGYLTYGVHVHNFIKQSMVVHRAQLCHISANGEHTFPVFRW